VLYDAGNTNGEDIMIRGRGADHAIGILLIIHQGDAEGTLYGGATICGFQAYVEDRYDKL